LHFCYNTQKHDSSYDDPKARIVDYTAFDKAYNKMEVVMSEKYGYHCDKNEWYGVQYSKNVAYHFNAENVFTLRVECFVWVYDANYLEIIQAIADVFNEAFEPEVVKQLPPEMVSRPLGHDFGFGDYVN
jgi:hypothetical protein